MCRSIKIKNKNFIITFSLSIKKFIQNLYYTYIANTKPKINIIYLFINEPTPRDSEYFYKKIKSIFIYYF